MDRMKSLLSKSLSQFILYTTIIIIGCAPLFFLVMKFCYIEDLDELIIYRYNEFSEETLPQFTISEIEIWNKYNEGIHIYPYDDSYVLDKPVEKFAFSKVEGHDINYRILYKKVEIENQPYILRSRIPMVGNRDLMLNLFLQYGLIFIIILFSLTVVQRVMSKKLWSAFYSSLGKIENYCLEQGDIPQFDKTDIKEFAQLNEVLSTLISNNLMAYKEQKEFIDNASHELQTPLAVLRAKLDILLQDSNLTKSQSETIQLLYDTSLRLTRLNKNLLLLAKIDNLQFKETHDIDFVNVLNNQLRYLKELAENNGLNVSVEINSPLIVKANSILLESLINNLIVNSIRHNINGGSISIVVNRDTFLVSNTGETSALNKDKIFKRFNHLSEEKKGNGLGLSIASRICKFHEWEIKYCYENNRHIFIVQFV